MVLLVLWLVVGRGYPIAQTQTAEKTPTTIYHYRDGMKEPFLFQFLFTMTGRLVMYTVMLYLFPLNPDFTVDSQFISLMIALTGIPGTILGIILAKKAEAAALPLPVFRGGPVGAVLRHAADLLGNGGHGVRHPAGVCDLHLHPLPVHPSCPAPRGHPQSRR